MGTSHNYFSIPYPPFSKILNFVQHSQSISVTNGVYINSNKICLIFLQKTFFNKIGWFQIVVNKKHVMSFVSHYGHDPRRDTPYWLDKVRMPTLVILGQADTVIPELGERIAPFVDGERIRVAEIDGAGHFFRDLNLDDAVDEAIGFIESVE